MPTYEYECTSCHNRFEKFESITARPTKVCPRCQKATARRLISAGAGLLFKGSGFYITDYRSAAYKKKAKEELKPAPAKTNSSPGKTNKS